MPDSKQNRDTMMTGSEIAVIGMAGRFPGAKSIDEFWENLKQGVESISFCSDEELLALGIDSELVGNANFVKAKGGVLEHKEYFDASFFDYTPREAEIMDPQMRVFHECAWEALENAGYDPRTYPGAIGLFAGATANAYWEGLTLLSGKCAELGYFASSYLNNKDFMSTKIAYKLDLKGPSFTLQTACSTSLVAIHLACQGILNGECDIALAGGVTISAQERTGYLYQEGMILSPDGHCRAFDAKAKGLIGGDGAGVVVLKSLEDALAERNHIYAVVKGTAVNNDGTRKIGYTAPSVKGQAEVIKVAHRVAEVEPESIGYVEAHGTGTTLGDPVEIEGLKLAFHSKKKGYCALGSVKTNVGHLDAAAGVAGFIKTALALKHRLIPPSLHFSSPNPGIDFKNSPFYVNTSLKKWQNQAHPLRAGVSSFGIGGSNAHVVLEEAPPPGTFPQSALPYLIVLSAKTSSALDQATRNLLEYLRKDNDIHPGDAAYTLQVGRRAFPHRRMLVSTSIENTIEILSSLDSAVVKSAQAAEKRPVIFMFSGLGAQYVNMGLDLYSTEPLFRETMDRCFEILKPITGYDLKSILYPEAFSGIMTSPPAEINQFDVAQVVIFVFEYSLARLLMKWGIEPWAMIGYSFGEYLAACISGVFSLEEALALVAARGKLIEKLPSGAMLSVPANMEELNPLLPADLSVAIDNGSSCVVSGTSEAVGAFEKQMKQRKYFCMPLQASHALHSQVMAPILEAFKQEVGRLKLKKPQVPYISNVTGNWIAANDAVDPAYWARHLRETVRFAEGIEKLAAEKNALFLEIGPGRDLSNLIVRCIENNPEQKVVNLVRPAQKKISDVVYLLYQVGRMWLWGVDMDWQAFHCRQKPHRIPLATYPFERQRYWIEGDPYQLGADRLAQGSLSFQDGDIGKWFYLPSWRQAVLPVSRLEEITRKKRWLLFQDNCGLGTRIVEFLIDKGDEVVTVKPGTGFDSTDAREYTINPSESAHYQQLIDECSKDGRAPNGVIHMWVVTPANSQEAQDEEFTKLQDWGFYSLLYLAQVIGRKSIPTDFVIKIITSSMQDVSGEETLSPGKATVLGPARVIPQEYPGVFCRCIDIILPDPANYPAERLVRQIGSELLFPSSDTVVAFRGNHRWVLSYEPVYLEEPTGAEPRLRERGVYLITGGLGEIGFLLAEFLAKSVQARLILTGRSVLPDRGKWNAWLDNHDANDAVSRKITKVLALETLGAEVMTVSVDAADREDMAEAIDRAKQEFGTIDGVIHAAGVVRGRSFKMIQEMKRDDCQEQFASKVYGLMNLEYLLNDLHLDFCWIISSISSVLGGLEFAAYSAVNSYIDSFVAHHNKHYRQQWLSIAWDGMDAVKTIAAFRRIFSLDHLNLVVVSNDGNLQTRINRWVKLEALRETGETSRETLPSASPRPDLLNPYSPPRDPLEETLVGLWQRLFGFEKIGIQDDFFELGGDSLKAITVISRMQRELRVEIPLPEFFQRSTVEKIAEYLKSAERISYSPIAPGEEREYYPLSSAMQRLYVLQQLNKKSTAYNETQVMVLKGQVDRDRLAQIFRRVIERHEILRTAIVEVDEIGLVQQVKPAADIDFRLQQRKASSEQEANRIIKNFARPFDLGKAPFIKAMLIEPGEDSNLMVLDRHHIATDGISHEIFVREFKALYEGETLPPVNIQYRDYSQWQRTPRMGKILKKQEEYWLKEFEGGAPVLNMPIDYVRPGVKSFAGKTLTFEIEREKTAAIKKIALEEGTTLYMALLAVYYVLLNKLTGQEDIVVGTPITGRRYEELNQVMGVFINTLALRNSPSPGKPFRDFLKEVRDRALAAFENQDYQLENLVEKVLVERDDSRNPLFDVAFELNNTNAPTELQIAEFQVSTFNYEKQTAMFDVYFYGAEVADKLLFKAEYCTDLFKGETIRRFIDYFKEVIANVVAKRDILIADIDISHDLLTAESINPQMEFAF